MSPMAAFALILLILLLVFFLLNTDPVMVDFLLSEQEISLALVIIIATMIGFVLGLIVPRVFRRSTESYELPENKENTDTATPADSI